MRVQANYSAIHARNERAFQVALDKNVERARRNLGGSSPGRLTSTVHDENLGRLKGRVGSSAPGARAQELGAYIVPRTRTALKYEWRGKTHFNRKAVRIRAKHWLRRAGEKWGEDMSAALRLR